LAGDYSAECTDTKNKENKLTTI